MRDRPDKPRREPKAPAAPDAGSLHAAALAHLARYAATQAGLARMLTRRVDRWARLTAPDAESVAQARKEIRALVARLAESGAVSDADFAAARARSLARAGRSRRAIGAHLANRGVPGELAAGAVPNDAAGELAAALIHARKRRLGPWRRAEASPELARRELASLARAGFSHDVARRALRLALEEAEATIIAFRAAL